MTPLTDSERADVESVAPRVRTLTLAMIGPAAHSVYTFEDVYQAAMEAVCRARKRWEPQAATFATYALNRARGAVLDFLREQRPGTRDHPAKAPLSLDACVDGEDGDTFLALLPCEDPEPRDHLLERQLWAAVDSLPRAQATVFRLVAEADLSQREVADVLGVTEAAVSVGLARARGQLAPVVNGLLAPVAA